MFKILQQIRRDGFFVSRNENSSTWHYRSLELTVHFDCDKILKITGRNRRD